MKILDEIDLELEQMESEAHGGFGDSITQIRKQIQSVKFQFSEEARHRVLGLVYGEAISGDLSQDQFFEQLTKIINE